MTEREREGDKGWHRHIGNSTGRGTEAQEHVDTKGQQVHSDNERETERGRKKEPDTEAQKHEEAERGREQMGDRGTNTEAKAQRRRQK